MRLERFPNRNGIGLSLRLDGVVFAVIDRVARCAIRRLTDEDAVYRRGRLQPRSRIDDIARRHTLSPFRPRAKRDQSLTGVDSDPHLQFVVRFADPVADRESRSQGAFRIVLMRRRRAEESHHCITDELLHRPAEALKLLAHALVVRPEQGADILRIELLRALCEADKISEEDADNFPFLIDRLDPRERGAARVAEARVLRILAAALRAADHSESVVASA